WVHADRVQVHDLLWVHLGIDRPGGGPLGHHTRDDERDRQSGQADRQQASEEAGPADRRAWSRHGTVTAWPSGTELGEQRLHLGDLGLLRVLDLLSHLEGARVLAVS